jgi:hypothetical protein
MWDVMQEFHKKMIDTGELLETRRKQQTIWMWNHITSHVLQVLNKFDLKIESIYYKYLISLIGLP